ncbi:ExeM/NucH family extracellular endonuclease [Actimicrobium sp. CCI2.3]|uniref:ExeM/NucH family extracellular endonuclease n=1 Tax=Actimicrobium sp. CCI2.3 TaxID=3048616 RepID=UPI002AB38F23|nr:ExeM/NucH family extracellular endonuclease [Actimicrobium sp. CCI2.3]MDY7574125.1 ExeM/NucH family extracellular endonuclease [Actimicrobium sp. CCI2.3]MEB0023255.1 ExeM/NucH family extracellular endonuclease [Actimicrobium sp. CCI2.3]
MTYFSCITVLCTALLTGCGGGSNSSSNSSDSSQAAPLTLTSAIRTVSGAPPCPAAPNPLRNITTVQGSSRLSPRAGQLVTLRGVVTGDFQETRQLHGFFLQQAEPDSKASTSEGIFVYLPSGARHVARGQYVQVSGTVEEYKSSSADPERLTRISAVSTISVCGSGPRITAQVLRLPVTSNKDFEALEGMLVRLPQTLTVTDNHDLGRHGEILLSANGRLWQPNNDPDQRDAATVSALNARSQILLDDGANVVSPSPMPYLSASDSNGTRRSGDTVSDLQGILTWSTSGWRIVPTETVTFAQTNPRPPEPEAVGGTLRVASMNVLNYFTTLNVRGATTRTELRRQRDKLVATIAGLDADVLGLMEIENNPATLDNLVSAINAQLGRNTYAAIDSGTPGSDAIKVALIYKPARVAPLGNHELPPTRGFLIDGGLRPPLAQHFVARDNNASFWMVVSHLKSKSSCPTDSRSVERDRGQGCWNATRTRQAGTLTQWVNTLVARSGDSNVLMLGDFNAYLDEDPIRTLEAAGYDDLLRRLPPAERYSYVFAGQAGALDHGFASKSLAPSVSGMTIWHSNADEPAVFDYHTESKPDDRFAATPWRASDHDPVLVGLTLPAP